jgi:hypothetical protein
MGDPTFFRLIHFSKETEAFFCAIVWVHKKMQAASDGNFISIILWRVVIDKKAKDQK